MVTLDVNMKNQAFSQYVGFSFNSMVKFDEKYLGASGDGLSVIEGKTDNGSPVEAELELPTTDFGIQNFKRIRYVYIGYETSSAISVNVVFDQKEDDGIDYLVESIKTGQQRGKFSVNRTQEGRYVTITVRNVNGSDFSLDDLSILLVVLHSGHLR